MFCSKNVYHKSSWRESPKISCKVCKKVIKEGQEVRFSYDPAIKGLSHAKCWEKSYRENLMDKIKDPTHLEKKLAYMDGMIARGL